MAASTWDRSGQIALQVFSDLEGQPAAGDARVLQQDLAEKYRGLSLSLEVIIYSVEEFSWNVASITRELFKRQSLHEEPA